MLSEKKTDELIHQAIAGDEDALAELFSRYKQQLRAMISFRMDRRLQGRVAPSDVLQEAYLDLAKRLPDFGDKGMSFFVWLRLVVNERLLITHRQHLKTEKRDAKRETPLDVEDTATGAFVLADHLAGRYTSVVGKAIQAEQRVRLQSVLETMKESDRDIIGLRIFEGLTNAEAAEVLGWNEKTSSSRFLRAIARLREALSDVPDFL